MKSPGIKATIIVLITAIVSLVTAASTASAVTVSFVDRQGSVIAKFQEDADLEQNVGTFSVMALERLKREGRITDFVASELGVTSIGDLGNVSEIISRSEMRAWGWCFRLNGVIPETYTHQTNFSSQGDELVWFYAHAHYLNGTWVTQCATESVD